MNFECQPQFSIKMIILGKVTDKATIVQHVYDMLVDSKYYKKMEIVE